MPRAEKDTTNLHPKSHSEWALLFHDLKLVDINVKARIPVTSSGKNIAFKGDELFKALEDSRRQHQRLGPEKVNVAISICVWATCSLKRGVPWQNLQMGSSFHIHAGTTPLPGRPQSNGGHMALNNVAL